MTTASTPTGPTTLTARSPDDILAVVPVVLGFVPTESVVMLTFGAPRPFHARVDLPGPGDDASAVGEMVESLRDPAVRHEVRRAVFVIYAAEALPAERVSRRLVRGFREAGIEVVDVLRADGRRWFPMLRSRHGAPPGGVPYDVSHHPFAAQAVLAGMVTHESRHALARQLDPDPDAVRRVATALDDEPAESPCWVLDTVMRHAHDRTLPDDAEAARLLLTVALDIHARDAAWTGMTRADARHHVELWVDLVRRSPPGLVGSAAAVLAMAAWLSGHGALAWCAVDRAEAAAPGHSLADLVASLLESAVPPDAWEEVFGMGDLDDPA